MAAVVSSPDPTLLDAPLRTAAGEVTTLRAHLHRGPLVVVFLRHFGCLFCRERAAGLRAREAELVGAGARIVFVGTGTPAQAADFARAHAGPHPVLVDGPRATFRAAGMRRSLWSTLHWRLLANARRAMRAGFRQTKVQGDPWQQGGVLVLGPKGERRHAAVDRAAGDPLDLEPVLAAVRSRD